MKYEVVYLCWMCCEPITSRKERKAMRHDRCVTKYLCNQVDMFDKPTKKK